MNNKSDYSGPVRLKGKPGARVQWGKRDAATARVVMQNMQQVTPPLVIPWHPHQEKIEKELRHLRVQVLNRVSMQNLVDTTTRHSEAYSEFMRKQLKAIMKSLSEHDPEIDHVDD